MDSTNINTNVAQIILPPDMELRKIKKPKKKSSLEKKKALKELKETLKQYDTAVAIAADKKIQLPAELGILPDNIADINSVKELKAFNATLKLRIQTINDLITQGAKKPNIFEENKGMGFPLLPARVIPPTSIQPSIIQPGIPQTPLPINPNQPAPPATQVRTDAEKTLEQIKQEILSKLSPADRAKFEAEQKAEAQREAGQSSGIPQQPIVPSPIAQRGTGQETGVIDTSNPQLFSKDIGYDIGGGTRVNIISPKGWTDIYTPYRMYIENITQELQKVKEGVFVLPQKAEEDLNAQRLGLLNQYETWSRGLTPRQLQYLDADKQLQRINSDMLKQLELDPKDIVKEIAKQQRIPLTQITDEQTELEKRAKERGLSEPAKELKGRLEKDKTIFDSIVSRIDELQRTNKLREQINQLNKEKAQITTAFNELAGTDRVSILSDFNKFNVDIFNLEESIEAKIADPTIEIDPITYKHSGGQAAGGGGAAPAPVVSPKPEGAGSAVGETRNPRFVKNNIIIPQNAKGALGRLLKFQTPGTQYTDKIKDSIDIILETTKLSPLINTLEIKRRIRDLPDATKIRTPAVRKIVKSEILDKVLIPIIVPLPPLQQ